MNDTYSQTNLEESTMQLIVDQLEELIVTIIEEVRQRARGIGEAAELAGLGLKLMQNPLVRSFLRSALESQLKKRFSV
jgi:hypothetical protein